MIYDIKMCTVTLTRAVTQREKHRKCKLDSRNYTLPSKVNDMQAVKLRVKRSKVGERRNRVVE